MIAAIVLLMPVPVSPTLAQVMRLSPLAAGEIVLADVAHAPVEQVAERRQPALLPPGVVELDLVEHPVRQPQGCARQRWIAEFRYSDGAGKDSAILSGKRATTEIALARSDGCPDAGYVHVNPGLTSDRAFAALSRLEAVRSGRSRVRFDCTDDTPSRLCSGDRRIRSELSRLTPWAVSPDKGADVVWLGIPGQIVTEIRLDPARPDVVTVRRRVPPPA